MAIWWQLLTRQHRVHARYESSELANCDDDGIPHGESSARSSLLTGAIMTQGSPNGKPIQPTHFSVE
jgi:hypothetical protein